MTRATHRRLLHAIGSVCLLILLAASSSPAFADIAISAVAVGNPGNVADGTGYGAVSYTYQMGQTEVTAGQYTAFLNAVAATDSYGLYNTNMWSSTYGCKIQQSGSPGSYTYVASDLNLPVSYVSWGDAARFANWLTNGQKTGAQDATTTEDGSYYLNGATTREQLMTVTRKLGAGWVIPTENEWYKAAYYDPNKPGGAGYWDYPTRSDLPPGTDKANYGMAVGNITDVGSYDADNAYGTYDQGGNVWEWNEAVMSGTNRGLRGGTFGWDVSYLQSSVSSEGYPTSDSAAIGGLGFRVAYTPEPATLSLLALGGIGMWMRRRRKA